MITNYFSQFILLSNNFINSFVRISPSLRQEISNLPGYSLRYRMTIKGDQSPNRAVAALCLDIVKIHGQIRDRRELPTPASQTPQALRDALSALAAARSRSSRS